MEDYKRKIESRLVKRLMVNNRTGCWEYQGFKPKRKSGRQYPLMGVIVPGRERQFALVHRVAAWLWLDTPLDPPPEILHDCDNKICCSPNPGHIREGTRSENLRDAYARGLQPKDRGSGKLTRNKVRKIRELYATGKYPQKRLAEASGVTQQQISMVVRKKNWPDA